MNIKGDITGMKELSKALENLPKNVSDRVIKKSLNESAWLITREARALARQRLDRRTGRLFRGINQGAGKKIRKPKGAASMAYKIGFTNTAPHGPILEFGTTQRHHKSGKSTGAVKPGWFMADAYATKRDEAQRLFETSALRIVDEETVKLYTPKRKK